MISNKEKRLSQAANETFIISDGNTVNSVHPLNYGLINNHHMNNAIKDPNIKKIVNNEYRNSHSLNHDFSQLYISNLKNHIDSHTNVKKIDPNPHSFEEISSYKKEALECKKQMFQMEKSISFWSECTEYWRNKWRKTRDEKNKLRDEVKQLKSRLNKLEYQLQISHEKRLRLGNEVNLLNEELSRYMYRFEDDSNNHNSRSRIKQLQQRQLHYNSDHRVDYRKKHRRKKDLFNKEHNNKNPNETSSSDTDSRNNAQPQSAIQKNETTNSLGKVQSNHQRNNPKIVFRQHERLFDKKIMNKKRFSQVVMLDEEEIFQMNKEISSIIKNSKNDNSTLKANNSIQQQQDSNEILNCKHRYMDYVPEDVEEEDSFDDGDDRIKPGQFFSDDIDFESAIFGGNYGSLTNDGNKDINLSNIPRMAKNYPNIAMIKQKVNGQSDKKSTESIKQESNEDNFAVNNQISKHETDEDEV